MPVLAKRFSFDATVILLHTSVKLGHITVCSFAVCVFFPSFISATFRGE